jgi:hypothetical protein
MRAVEGGYLYNLEVPTKLKNSDGSFTELKANDLLTVRVRSFGDDKAEASMYVVLKVAR